ncbi:MAG: hypothetical protein JWO38_6981 [Gemmataceae bacterium]|nr:hypothetical protein [Gemmataceae bacterium]
MSESYLTMAEIEARYPNEWVLIDRPRKTRYEEVLGGYVVYHGPDKLALYSKIDELPKPFDIAVRYLGPLVEEDVDYLLNADWTE